jgi:glycosyl hydrolase family 106( putative alpha-L-rhamnosidase)
MLVRRCAAPLLAALLLTARGSARLRPETSEAGLQTHLTDAGITEVQRLFTDPPANSRIMMRWWWFGPSATREELDAEMRHMKEGGIGGFEVAAVYPLAVDDPARGFRNYPYLSAEFLDRIAFTSRRARELGLRMDLTIGSGWSYGGPYITPELAATRLRSERREIAPDVVSIERPAPFEHDRLIAAFIASGSVQEADPASFREVTIPETGRIALPSGRGPRVVLLYFSGQTGQIVKRAAVGAEGYVLDHYSREAIQTHLREAGDKMLAVVDPGSIDSIFCDSLEVYDGDWTRDLFDEFKKRRGYDLRPLLPVAELGAGDRAETIRRDYGRTLTELFEARFLVPMHEWASQRGVKFRIQNYGMPPASIATYRHADIFDGEGFEWRTLSATRWASSASHLFGRPVTSSETWTWLHSPAFRATPLDLKAEADQHFLAGINQLIGHGWPYSPPEARSPGWMFYAAGAYTDKNPWWPVMPDTARYLQRVSYLLRQGDPIADVALYAPTEDAWSEFRPGNPRSLNLFSDIHDLIGTKTIPAILDAGHAVDVVDEGTLAEARARRYRLIVLPAVKRVSEAARRGLAEYVASGGKLIATVRKPEGEWPSLQVVREDELRVRLTDMLTADLSLSPETPAIGFVHRRLSSADIYFLANTSNARRTVRARFGSESPQAELWDPMTGAVERIESSDAGVSLTFEPHGSHVIVFRKESGAPARAAAVRRERGSIELKSGWTLAVGPTPREGTVVLPHSWADEERTRYFSGTATYRRSIDVPAAFHAPGGRVFLDFGAGQPVERGALPGGTMRGNSFAALIAPPVREAATVFVNDRRAGSVWAPPYRVEVTDLLRAGSNDIRIEVYNTAINQLAEGGRLPDVAAVTDRYGQRFRLQDLDDLKPIPSGILSVPRLVVER